MMSVHVLATAPTFNNKKSALSLENRAMPQVFLV